MRDLQKELPVYDIICAGPRNKFTILSVAGPLIVHNCGYGAAGPRFKSTAKTGLYGPPVDISIEDAADFVQLYRTTNPSVCDSTSGYWAQCNRMMLSLYQGDYVDWGPLQIKEHEIFLPNSAY